LYLQVVIGKLSPEKNEINKIKMYRVEEGVKNLIVYCYLITKSHNWIAAKIPLEQFTCMRNCTVKASENWIQPWPEESVIH